MNVGMNVQGKDFKGNNICGTLEHVVGFGLVGVVKTGDDRLNFTECYLNELKEITNKN